VPTQFTFTGKHPDREQSVFIQDLAHSGPWTLSAGIRWDHYRLLTRGQGFSPRLGVSHYWRSQNLAFHASYDRALEFPATENLLLSSSPAAQHLTSSATGLPVPASHGNFYQAGFTKGIAGHVRVDANYFVRDIRNFFDDDLLLNTGVSFPIAFASAVIRGTEASFEVPQWRKFSGFISYTNQLGVAHLPVTGGLFLEPNSAALLHSTDRFPVSQDQRNTAHARLRWQAARNLWVASEAQYGSGLPIESDEAPSQLLSEYGAQILQQVNFARGRMRPQFSFDASAAVTVWTHGDRSARLQADVVNLTNRLNVINFAGLFSGTALGLPRSFGVRLETRF
jgi:hypothetical protein